ncbi:caspase family protein [Dyadobacter diqingensis]|uniref:caspase family protein n=1 Tax=Dyadobacter diqingensis TaxID=2938121 RepID=UPI0020C1A895|nr:caspase family protein [Dyadobacter diqingensis]
MYKMLFFCLIAGSALGKDQQKYALIIQNLKFANYSSFEDELKNNASELKGILVRQEFPPGNITVRTNLAADSVRQVVDKFTQSLPPGSIVVVYLGSHGLQLRDYSGDEAARDRDHQDRADELFVCIDSSDSTTLAREGAIRNKAGRLPDHYRNAIADDEIGDWNRLIMNKLGSGGHYLYLADFCTSVGGTKGEGAWESERIEPLEQPGNAGPATFVGIMASTKKVGVPIGDKSRVGYFVNAIDFALHRFLICPTYQQFYEAFFEKMTSFRGAYPDKGKPGWEVLGKEKASRQLFNGNWVSDFAAFAKTYWRQADKLKGNKEGFYVPNPQLYTKGMHLEIKENDQIKAEGVVKELIEKEVRIDFFDKFEASKNINYTLMPSESRENALNAARISLNQAKTKLDLKYALRELNVKKLGVVSKSCANDYIDKGNGVLEKKECQPLADGSVKLGDNLTVQVNLPPEKKLYFTILDATEEKGLVHCFQDPDTKDPKGFYSTHRNDFNETNFFRTMATEPLSPSVSSFWILVSEKEIEDEEFRINWLEAGSSAEKNRFSFPEQKENLWDMIQNIVYFEEIDYQVKQR